MALGDVTLFNTAKLGLLNGTHDLDTHVLKLAIVTNAVVPVETQAAPTLATYTEVAIVAGGYTPAGGTTITVNLFESAGVVTFNPTINPTWPAIAGGSIDAYWGILYNTTNANIAIGFVDLGGPINMATDATTVTWHPSGLFTLQVL